MKIRVSIAAAALCFAIIGMRCLTRDSNATKRTAADISVALAKKMLSSSGVKFELGNKSFLESSGKNRFYVVLEFKSPGAGDKLQEVFFFDAEGGQPRMKWSYSVVKNLAKLTVNEAVFVDDGATQIQRKQQGFEMQIALTPAEWDFQAETIARLGRQGVEMSVSLEGHPDLKPLKIVKVTDEAECLAEFPSRDDALYCAEILKLKIRK